MRWSWDCSSRAEGWSSESESSVGYLKVERRRVLVERRSIVRGSGGVGGEGWLF